MHNYLIQDMRERVWVVPSQLSLEFLLLAKVKGPHQVVLDELSLSREKQDSIGVALTGNPLWSLAMDLDFPVRSSWHFLMHPLPDAVVDALEFEPVNPADIDALRAARYA